MKTHLFIAIALAALVSSPARAESPPKVLLEGWYTVSIGKDNPKTGMKAIRYGYYHDKASIEDGKVKYLNEYWKKEEGFINEEKLGTVSKNDDSLQPIFYNFRSKYRNAETNIDGLVEKGTQMTITVRKPGAQPTKRVRGLSQDTIFASQFPLWIGRRLSKMKPGKAVNFRVLLEDDQGKDFQPLNAKATLEPFDDFSRSSKTQKIKVDLDGQSTHWYVKPDGLPVRLLLPSAQIEVNLVSEKEAKNFLGE